MAWYGSRTNSVALLLYICFRFYFIFGFCFFFLQLLLLVAHFELMGFPSFVRLLCRTRARQENKRTGKKPVGKKSDRLYTLYCIAEPYGALLEDNISISAP